jgi:hypothetical protein
MFGFRDDDDSDDDSDFVRVESSKRSPQPGDGAGPSPLLAPSADSGDAESYATAAANLELAGRYLGNGERHRERESVVSDLSAERHYADARSRSFSGDAVVSEPTGAGGAGPPPGGVAPPRLSVPRAPLSPYLRELTILDAIVGRCDELHAPSHATGAGDDDVEEQGKLLALRRRTFDAYIGRPLHVVAKRKAEGASLFKDRTRAMQAIKAHDGPIHTLKVWYDTHTPHRTAPGAMC